MKSIALITLGFVLWAVIHSVLADHQLKQRFRQRFGDRAYRWYRLAYNVFATLSLLPLLQLYRELPDRLLWQAPSPWQWFMVSVQVVGLLGLIAAVLHTRVGEFAGVTQLLPGYDPDRRQAMRVSGLYRLVRHPIYFFGLLLVWFSPQISTNSLTVAVLASLYFYYGARHEETGLRAEFGPAYDIYRQQVPMLIPRLGRYQHDET